MGEANRKTNFTVLLTEQERLGKRVESRTDYSAVLVKSKPIAHTLHLVLTVPTLGLWGLLWLLQVLTRGETRERMEIDGQGFVKRTRI